MKICFISLGCDKNLVDTEHMLFLLNAEGYEIVSDADDADICVINSCCFIRDALEESIQTIIEVGKKKKTGHVKSIILAGCMGQRFTEDVLKDLPEVDAIVGTNSYDEIVSAVKKVSNGEKTVIKKDFSGLPKSTGRIFSGLIPSGSLKIAEGCDKRCTYCIIPYIRGSYRSVPMEELLQEAADMAASGIREINLVAQEVTLYGIDLYGKKMLPELVRKLSEVEGIQWIRLLYCYPEEITDELITEIQTNPKVCHYLDMPIQHCCDDLLKRMGRKTTEDELKQTITKLRERIPDISLRTTIICGFPGESAAQHQKLLDFLEEARFDRLGAFAYSKEDGTPAADYSHQLSERKKRLWVDDVMQKQKKIILQKNESFIGQTFDCFIEGSLKEGVYVGRTYRDAPDVDGYLFVETDSHLLSGDIIRVKITGSREYDLIGEEIHEPAK